jgi:hypothetical protein
MSAAVGLCCLVQCVKTPAGPRRIGTAMRRMGGGVWHVETLPAVQDIRVLAQGTQEATKQFQQPSGPHEGFSVAAAQSC